MNYTEIYFQKEIRSGYGWLFPKGMEANVGLGAKQMKGRRNVLKELLRRLIHRLVDEGKIRESVHGTTGGWMPASPVDTMVRGNILLAGDAAGQTHPISGAGVFPAVICGRMAGKWASRAVQKGDMRFLLGYAEEWRDFFGPSTRRALERRRLLEKEWRRFDEIIRCCWIAYKEYYRSLK
jgi:flavin-dependent dehydrogenase